MMPSLRGFAVALAAAMLLHAQPHPHAGFESCSRCGWRRSDPAREIMVTSVSDLHRAVSDAKPGDAILVADGDYALQRSLQISTPRVTLRSSSGNPDRVILHGRGMQGDHVGVAIAVGATDVTIADITIRAVGYHAVQVRGENGASRFTLHNVKLQDAGQQLLKGSIGTNGQFAADGLIACSEFSYTTSAPSDYTNGVDILGTRSWTIRDNRFYRIRGPATRAWRSGPAILAWRGAQDTVVERNLVVDSYRGIALGLVASDGDLGYDHLRGTVRNNVVVNLQAWADEGIEVNGALNARVEHNTVLVEGGAPWSISVRFPTTSAHVRNNLSNRQLIRRDGAAAQESGNVSVATRRWFVDPPGNDLHLVATALRAIDTGIVINDVLDDFDGTARPVGGAPDAGALEFPPGRPRLTNVSGGSR